MNMAPIPAGRRVARDARGATSRAVARALHGSATAAGIAIDLSVEGERDWASALFEGVRITLRGTARAGDFETWLAALPEADLPLRGHFIASAEVTGRPAPDSAVIELLAIAES